MEAAYREQMLKTLSELMEIPAPSGYIGPVTEYLTARLNALGLTPQYLRQGGVYAKVGGEGNDLLIMAHADDIGLMVRNIRPDGRLTLTNIGGMHAAYCDQANVLVHTRKNGDVSGTVRFEEPSIHIHPREETLVARDLTKNTLVFLDADTRSREETEALGIRPGDFISVEPRFRVLDNGYIKGRFLDDKAAVAVLLTYLAFLHDSGRAPRRAVWADFTLFEEIGHGGNWIPDGIRDVLALDIGPVGSTTDCDEHKVFLCAKDAAFPFHREMLCELEDACEHANVPYTVDVLMPNYGSDVDVTLRAGYDVRHGLCGPGVVATHGYERTHVDSLIGLFDLLCSYTL